MITNCSARKRVGAGGGARFSSHMVNATDVGATVRAWRAELARHSTRFPARELYKGRAFSEVQTVRAKIGAELLVVSAGLGVVTSEASVPSYDLSPSDASSAFAEALTGADWNLSDWWAALTNGRGLCEHLGGSSAATVFVAMPATYLSLVVDDLQRSIERESRTWFLFTSPRGQRLLPTALSALAMPYDERLETVEGFAGTRSDFPQRAMHHFVAEIWTNGGSALDARRAVAAAMDRARFKPQPIRRRLGDDEIRELIREHWNVCEGVSAVQLRYLRDVLFVSCEQGRFARLRRDVLGCQAVSRLA